MSAVCQPCGWLPGVDGATIRIAIPHQSASAADPASPHRGIGIDLMQTACP
jgi:hypothetical protein